MGKCDRCGEEHVEYGMSDGKQVRAAIVCQPDAVFEAAVAAEADRAVEAHDSYCAERVLWLARHMRAYGRTKQHCPECRSEEWFPGAACWHCGWEADNPLLERLTNAARSATEAYKHINVCGGNPNRVKAFFETMEALAAALLRGGGETK